MVGRPILGYDALVMAPLVYRVVFVAFLARWTEASPRYQMLYDRRTFWRLAVFGAMVEVEILLLMQCFLHSYRPGTVVDEALA